MLEDLKKRFADQAKIIFEGNLRSGHSSWKNTYYRFISPASKEYTFQWLWDTAFHAIVLSHFDTNWAKSEITNFLKAQWSDGFLPHIVFWGNRKILPHWAYIESKISLRPRTSAITQPPALALAVEAIFEKDRDTEFLKATLPKLAKYHRWLLQNRDPDGDYLISIISPNESGMDELPAFQAALGFLGINAAKIHYYYRKVDFLNKRYRFKSKTILEKDYFDVEELLFNCIFIEASRSLARLLPQIGEEAEALFFKKVADKAEDALLKKCWDNQDKIFYSIFSKDEHLAKVKTVASLIPLFLDGLKDKKLKLLIKNHLLNPKEFWTNYPFPSVSKNEIYYVPINTPIHQVKLLWRGPTWISTNWLIVKGLRKHGFTKLANQVVSKMVEMIKKEGFREYYNPETGEGYRRQNFGWSTLILDLLV
jgi:glycogen debranching enzyme